MKQEELISRLEDLMGMGSDNEALEMAIKEIKAKDAFCQICINENICYRAEPMRWIPVTESLPKESDGTVLVCMPDVSPYNEEQPYPNCEISQRVRTGMHSEHSGRWYYENGGVGGDDPIAWMPLPKPYQGKESE